MTQRPVEAGSPFFQHLFKSIGDAQLTVHDHFMPMPPPQADRLYDLFMTAGSYRAEIMFIIHDILRCLPERQVPVAGLRECFNHRIRCLPKQHEDCDQDPQQREHQYQSQHRPPCSLPQYAVTPTQHGILINLPRPKVFRLRILHQCIPLPYFLQKQSHH